MAERPTGFSKTTRLDTGRRGRGKPSISLGDGAPRAVADGSGSGMEMVVGEDVGRKIAGGRYEVIDVIGEGGMGVVYEAWDTQVERKVAIKLVRSDTTDRKFVTRFRRELEITSKLRHPSTIRVFEHGETDDGRPYMVMELLTGQSLAERMERGALDERDALQIARQVAESLSEAHEHGIFHRDLKPDNIFIETVGVSKVVKVLDFGIAGGIDASRLTQAGEVFGTPQYMSPEQCNGLPLDHRTDIYSLACILYEMIEGRPPFSSDTPMATMLKHVRTKVPTPRNANASTAKVVLMGLRKDRGKRIQTAGRFSELIGQCIGHLRAIKDSRMNDSSRAAPVAMSSSASIPIMVNMTHPAAPTNPMGATAAERTGRTVAIMLVLVALGLVGLLVFGDFSSDPEASEAVEGSPPAAAAAGEAPEYKDFPFNRPLVGGSLPGATVFVDDVEQCETPCIIKVPVGDDVTHEIRLRKPGYVDVVLPWRPRNVGEPLPPLPSMQRL